MNNRIKLSEITQLKVSQCLTLEISFNNSMFDILLVCFAEGKLAAFLNHCPHTGVNLNWQPNQCFDSSNEFLSCSLHGALFRPDDGKCVYGPCIGQSLKRLELEIEGVEVFVCTKSLFGDYN